MIAKANRALESLETALARGGVVDFGEFVAGRRLDDREVAELIEVDARARLETGLPVDLDRYLSALPTLEQMPIALDAAIEFGLRTLSGNSRPTDAAVDALVSRHPALEVSIRNAAALSAGMATTHTLQRLDRSGGGTDAARSSRVLPSDFGPAMADGRARYELVDWLGSGSQGEVYLAVDRAMSQADRPATVAIKVLATALLSEQERWLAVDEAARARRVTHQNVVRVLDRGAAERDGKRDEYIVYEHIDGGDLGAWLREQRPDHRAVALLMAQVARGVQAAHHAGLVHRDLKPPNVLLTREGVPKVTDFGTAALVGEVGASAAGSASEGAGGGRVGNLAFIAPEQYRREATAQSSQVDVYALGGVLYHGLTGRLPHGWTATSVERALGGGRAQELPGASPIEWEDAGVDLDLVAIVERALAARPEDRYATADALATDLEAWSRHEPIAWMRPSAARRLRLLARRAPRQVRLVGAAATVVALATGAAVVVSARAGERVRRAEVERITARAYADAQQRKQEEFAGRFQRVQSVMKQNKDLEPTDWFPTVTILESLMGPYFFGTDQVSRHLWDDRIAVGQRQIADREASGQGAALETLLWRDLLTYWLLRASRAEEALRMADGADAGWGNTLAKDDPWRLVRRGLRAAGEVRLGTADSVETLRELEGYLDGAGGRHGDALHMYVVETLVRAYEQGANHTAELSWSRDKLKKLRGESYYEQYDLLKQEDGTRGKRRSIWE